MNRIHSVLAVIAAMLIFHVHCGCQQRSDRPDVAGYWYGQSAANPNVVVVLWFRSEDGVMGGKAFFPAGATLRSAETLRNIVLSGTSIVFDLPTMGTHYAGKVSSTEINGGFDTPGNPFMAFTFTRTELDTLPSAAAIRTANKPYDLHRMFTRDQLEADLAVLKKGVLSHPRALLYNSREQWEGYFRNADRKIEKGMSLVEFVRVAAPLIADLKCYHSQLVLPEKMGAAFVKESNSIPLDIVYVGDRAYVRRSFVNDPMIEPGSEILAINGMPVNDILRRLAACISADGMNMSYKRAQINGAFWYLYHYIDSPEHYDVTLQESSASRRINVSVKAVPSRVVRDAMASAQQAQTEADPNAVPVSLSIRDGVGVLDVRSFLYFDQNKYRQALDSLFAELTIRRVATLVVDVRGNGGGHPALAAHLFSFFIRRAAPYLKEPRNDPHYAGLLNPVEPAKNGFRGRVFFLSDGYCLSSTGHFLALVKYYKLGKIVGDIPGGSFTCSDEAQLWNMPNSGIQFTIARTVFTAAVEGYRTGDQVIPDYTVKPTLSDLLANKDAVMEAVRRLIHER